MFTFWWLFYNRAMAIRLINSLSEILNGLVDAKCYEESKKGKVFLGW